MTDFLRDLALAHQKKEGFFPGSRAWRNNNPGNLRSGPPSDTKGFTIFSSYAAGFQALANDLEIKICGKSKHIDYTKNPTFLTYVRVYAPSDDGNDPKGYCQTLCTYLGRYKVQPSTSLTELCHLVRGEKPAILPPPLIVTPEEHVKALTRRLENEKDPTMRDLITRVLKRLLARLSS